MLGANAASVDTDRTTSVYDLFVTTLLALARAIHFASLMTIFGSESLRALLARLPRAPEDRLPGWVLSGAAAAALASAVLWLVLATGQMRGDTLAMFDPSALWMVATDTFFGHVAGARIAILALLLALIRVPGARTARIGLSGLALGAIALTSHVAASGDPDHLYLRAANDAAHLLAAGFWIGALVLLVPLAAAHRNALRELLPTLRLFSSWGILAVAVLVAAGTLNGYLVLFGVHARWSPIYTTVLAAKIVLAALMVSLALANRFSLLPGIRAGKPEAEDSLYGSAIAELVIGLLIVAIVAVLGLLPPMR